MTDHKKRQPIPEQAFDDAESTDVSKAGDIASPDGKKSRGTLKQAPTYDWSEVAYLFEDGLIPAELLEITDPIEYNYLIVRLKKEFNEKHRSDYLKYMHLDLPYHSRRDELGGVISDADWLAFTRRLEGVIDKIKAKRKRIIKRRKRKGKKLMPRSTLFKPKKKEDLKKNPLWQEVFMHEDSDDNDGSGSDAEEQEIMNMYRDTLAVKGIKPGRQPGSAMLTRTATKTHGGLNNDLILPPINAHRP